MGRREDPGGVREGIPRPPSRGIREVHTRRHSDGQLSKGGRRLQVTTQRPPGQRRPQVCDAETFGRRSGSGRL